MVPAPTNSVHGAIPTNKFLEIVMRRPPAPDFASRILAQKLVYELQRSIYQYRFSSTHCLEPTTSL